MFNFIKNKLTSIYSQVSSKINALFNQTQVNEETLKELEKILITADTGIKTTHEILASIRQQIKNGTITHGTDLKKALEEQLLKIVNKTSALDTQCPIILLVGINGSGKTTCAGKLAALYRSHNQSVMLVAADTFRAGATDQLEQWAERTGTTLFKGTPNQDPASVVFTACHAFKEGSYKKLIIDTAGRLQTKEHLMRELEKIKRTINRQLPTTPICTLLVLDSMLGQNSFQQAKLFHESTPLDGIILTKMDGTSKGGIIFAIIDAFKIPVAYISFGEQTEHIKPFDAQDYVQQLLNS